MTCNMKGGCQLQKNVLFPSSGQKLIFLTKFLDPVLLTYLPVISGIWLVVFLKLRLWCTSRYRLLLVTEFWQELTSVTARIDRSIPASQLLAIEHQMMIDTWLMSLNGRVRKGSWPNSRYYPGLLLYGLRKITKILSVDISPGRRDLIIRPLDL